MSSLRRPGPPRPSDLPRTGLPAGLIAAAGGALMVIGAFLAWLRTDTRTGGTTAISGFGGLSGDLAASGENLNDMLSIAGMGSYRPGLIGLIFGIIVLLVAFAVAARRPHQPRPFRIAAALLVLAGIVGAGWGLFRGIDPGTGAGVLPDDEATAGAGPWLTAGGSLLVLAAAVWLLLGRADPGVAVQRPGSRGIQPG